MGSSGVATCDDCVTELSVVVKGSSYSEELYGAGVTGYGSLVESMYPFWSSDSVEWELASSAWGSSY